MKKQLFILLLLIPLCINLFGAERKSVKKAMLFSAILPGAGQVYSNNYTRAGVFFASEAAIWFGKTRLENERDWTEKSYRRFANTIGNADYNTLPDKYDIIQDYISSDVYNNETIMNARNYFLIIYNDPEGYQAYLDENLFTGDETWDWKSDDNRRHFKQMRQRKQTFEIYSKFAFSALIINRFISVIDAARSTSSYNRHQVFATPSANGKGLSLNYEYHF